MLDADMRYLLRPEMILDPTGDNVERVLDSAFQELGLPKAMRSDNGPPFGSTGAGRLSRLSVWWMKPGIELERIEPGKRRDYNDVRPREALNDLPPARVYEPRPAIRES